MVECENLCKIDERTCKFCQENNIVSRDFYVAERSANSNKVMGYLVKSKKSGEIKGILTKATNFYELAWIKPKTLELYTGDENQLKPSKGLLLQYGWIRKG